MIAVDQIVTDLAAICGLFIALVAVVVILKRPLKWLWRKNVVQPLTHWFRAQVREVVNDELDRRPLTNGWGTRALHEVAVAVEADVEAPNAMRPEGQ